MKAETGDFEETPRFCGGYTIVPTAVTYCAATKTEFGMVANKKAGIVIVASDIF